MRPFAVEKLRFPASPSFKSGKGICAMKRLLVFFCTALLLLSACATPPPAATPMPVESPKTPEPPIKTPAPTRTPEPAVPPELAVSEALVQEVYLRLCAPEFEGRFAGSDANARAGEYLAGLLSEYGYAPLLGDSMLVPYSAPLGDPGMLEATAELHFPNGGMRSLAIGADYAFRLPWEDVSLALPLALDAATAADGSAFLLTENRSPSAPYAVIESDPLTVQKHVRANEHGLHLYVTPEIAALCKTPGAELRFSAKDSAWEGTAHNVVAVLPGADRSRAMILGAHFDGTGTWGGVLYPSALDNASGAAALIGAASVLAERQLPFDVVFALFNSEENSLRGSAALAEQLLARYDAMNLINLDCLGYAGAEPFSFAFLTESNAFAKALWPYLQHVGYPPYWTDSTISSDHLSFSERGILSITLLEYPDSGAYCHMPQDTPDRLCAERIAAVAAGVVTFLLHQEAPLNFALPLP